MLTTYVHPTKIGPTMTATHTPTPWEYDAVIGDSDGWIAQAGVEDGSGLICRIARNGVKTYQDKRKLSRAVLNDVDAANAAHIVACVNAHDKLVAALRECAEDMEAHGYIPPSLSRAKRLLAELDKE